MVSDRVCGCSPVKTQGFGVEFTCRTFWRFPSTSPPAPAPNGGERRRQEGRDAEGQCKGKGKFGGEEGVSSANFARECLISPFSPSGGRLGDSSPARAAGACIPAPLCPLIPASPHLCLMLICGQAGGIWPVCGCLKRFSSTKYCRRRIFSPCAVLLGLLSPRP